MQTEPLPSESSFDPYGRIREKINAGSKKFKEYKDQPCCLVLYNVNVPLVELQVPDVMFGATEGDYALLIPINTTARRADERRIRNAFLDSRFLKGWALTHGDMKDYLKYYDREQYLFDDVNKRFTLNILWELLISSQLSLEKPIERNPESQTTFEE